MFLLQKKLKNIFLIILNHKIIIIKSLNQFILIYKTIIKVNKNQILTKNFIYNIII